MFERFRTEGIIIAKRDSGEFDRIFTAYTRDFGKVSFLGKAIRKSTSKLKSGIDFFSLLDLEFIQGKGQKMLVDSCFQKSYQGIKKSIEKISIFDEITRKLNNLVKQEEKDLEVWNLLKEIIYELNVSNSDNVPFFYFYFIWNVLAKLGYQPSTNNCLVCGKKIEGKSFFNVQKGGLVCNSCPNQENIILSNRFIQILKVILAEDWKLFSSIKFNEKDKENFSMVTECFLKARE